MSDYDFHNHERQMRSQAFDYSRPNSGGGGGVLLLVLAILGIFILAVAFMGGSRTVETDPPVDVAPAAASVPATESAGN